MDEYFEDKKRQEEEDKKEAEELVKKAKKRIAQSKLLWLRQSVDQNNKNEE